MKVLNRRSVRCGIGLLLAVCLPGMVARAFEPLHPPVIFPHEGRPEIMWQDADQFTGKPVVVYGKVLGARSLSNLTLLDFDESQPSRFSVVVRSAFRRSFPQNLEEAFVGRVASSVICSACGWSRPGCSHSRCGWFT